MSDLAGWVELDLVDAGAVGQARLAAKELAHELGASGESADRLVMVVSELATSLVVHGGGGTIGAATARAFAAAGAEVALLDRDVAAAQARVKDIGGAAA